MQYRNKSLEQLYRTCVAENNPEKESDTVIPSNFSLTHVDNHLTISSRYISSTARVSPSNSILSHKINMHLKLDK